MKSRLVWSDDPKDLEKIKQESEFYKKQAELRGVPVNLEKVTAVFRLEKGGRGGKTVTVLDQLPKNEDFLKTLCKELKSKCGTGGTYKIEEAGQVEIQGDKREEIKKILTQKNIKFKGM